MDLYIKTIACACIYVMMKTIDVTEFEKHWLPYAYNYKYLNTDLLNYLKYCSFIYWKGKKMLAYNSPRFYSYS